MLNPRKKLELIADLLEYPEAERDLTGAPNTLRKCANHIFELETQVQAQNETLNGVRMLLDIPPGKSLLQAVQRLVERIEDPQPKAAPQQTQDFPIKRTEIKRRLDNLEIEHKSKDSTKVLFNRLVRTLKDKGIIDDLVMRSNPPPSQKSIFSL